MKRISTYILISFVLLMQGCMREDSWPCDNELLLRFRYTLNDQRTNLFDSDIERVTIYLFDDNGKYVDSFSEQGPVLTNDYVMRIPLPEGKYSVVVYGGNFTTYSVGQINNGRGVEVISQTLIKGLTDINDFRMELKNTTGQDGYLYSTGTPDDLFAGLATNAVSTFENENITDVELIRDTKNIKVKITGTSNEPLDVHITALNGRYGFDNSIDPNHGTFKYTPLNTLIQTNYMQSDLRMMRLVLGQSPMLVIKSSTTGQILYNENMIEQILSTHLYTRQEDLDREDEFIFEISMDRNVVISVLINGWIVNDINPEI